MTITEKLFALKKIPLFNRLRNSELILIAEVASVRRFGSGEKVVSSGVLLQSLYVVVQGAVQKENSGTSAPIFGIESLIFEKTTSEMLQADSSDGATCLVISKGHFFTIVNECPNLAIGFLETPVL